MPIVHRVHANGAGEEIAGGAPDGFLVVEADPYDQGAERVVKAIAPRGVELEADEAQGGGAGWQLDGFLRVASEGEVSGGGG